MVDVSSGSREAIHNNAHLHVARTRSLSPSSGNVLANITRRHNNLRLANIVVLQEDNLEQITNLLIIIDHLADLVDEVDNRLRHPVTRRRFAAEDADLRLHLLAFLGRHLLDLKIPMDDAEDVELLSLVLVHTLYLDVE